jgi:hypothetical protein
MGSLGSSPLRSDGSRNDQAGEAGPVEQCSAEAKCDFLTCGLAARNLAILCLAWGPSPQCGSWHIDVIY